jgi:hypothetical protein
VTPDEFAAIVAEVGDHRDHGGHFDAIVWAVAPDTDRRREYDHAGARWLVEGPAPGSDWLEDAAAIAPAGPPSP